MIPTPSDLAPAIGDIGDLLYPCLDDARDFADGLLDHDSDTYFWSHCARYRLRNLVAAEIAQKAPAWQIMPGVPNSGVHLTHAGVSTARVVRSLHGTVPHPGSNRRRRRAWQGTAGLSVGPDSVPVVSSLLFDWHLDDDRDPVVHVSLPKSPWGHGADPELHWRVQINRASGFLAGLSFNAGDDDTGDLVLPLHFTEDEANDVG